MAQPGTAVLCNVSQARHLLLLKCLLKLERFALVLFFFLEENAWSLKAGNEMTEAILELALPPTPSPKSTACGCAVRLTL